VKFSNFLFPESRSPGDDGRIIHETLAEARLTDELGFDVIWLAEHHFDGICAYADPVAFAAALSQATKRATIGFAVAQMALHHPVRFAEQMALIDHMTNGRLIVGLGRGTAYNIYDYQGYGIDPDEAQGRFEEAEALMVEAWSGKPVDHKGKYFEVKFPELRPSPFTKPHPYLIRAAASEHGMLEIAAHRRPFMINVQSDAIISERMEKFRNAVRATGASEEEVAKLASECWIWRNVVVADTDAEAERIAVPSFVAMNELRGAMRERVIKEQGLSIAPPPSAMAAGPVARTSVELGLVYGSPATVAAKLAPVVKSGAGGMIIQFRIGPMSFAQAGRSMTLFQQSVVPELRAIAR